METLDNNNENPSSTGHRRALGRGLEELFSNEVLDYNSFEEKLMENSSREEVVEISLDELRANPYQPRKVFDEKALNELANSIKENGVIQPIIAKKSIKGYEIIAGERRVKASKMAGLTKIPAIIRDFTDDEMMQIALLENLQRENLNAIEEAQAYRNLLGSLHVTQDELAKRLGKSRSHITNMLGLLNLPREVKDLIGQDKISMGHARVLSKLQDSTKVIELAHKIVDEGLSVRDLEKLTQEDTFERKVKQNKVKKVNEYAYLENDLQETLGTKVKVSNKKVEIYFANTADLNRLLEIMHLNNK
jgi:ParB family chromosome partitioning protein